MKISKEAIVVYSGVILLLVGLKMTVRHQEKKAIQPVQKSHTLILRGEDLNLYTEPIKIETINKRGDKKVHKIKGNLKFNKDYYKDDIVEVEFDLTPDVIKAENSKHKISLCAYRDQMQLGYQYEVFYFADYKIFKGFENHNINVGFTTHGMLLTLGHSLTQHTEVFVGTSAFINKSPEVVWGVQIKL